MKYVSSIYKKTRSLCKTFEKTLLKKAKIVFFIISMSISVVLVILIIAISVDTKGKILQIKTAKVERAKLLTKLSYWEKVSKKYDNYPNAYLKMGIIEYRLRNLRKSSIYFQKDLLLNPGDDKARNFLLLLDKMK